MVMRENKPIIQEEPRMVKKQKNVNTKRSANKGENKNEEDPKIINANTHYETCSERLSPFGGLLALIKF